MLTKHADDCAHCCRLLLPWAGLVSSDRLKHLLLRHLIAVSSLHLRNSCCEDRFTLATSAPSRLDMAALIEWAFPSHVCKRIAQSCRRGIAIILSSTQVTLVFSIGPGWVESDGFKSPPGPQSRRLRRPTTFPTALQALWLSPHPRISEPSLC